MNEDRQVELFNKIMKLDNVELVAVRYSTFDFVVNLGEVKVMGSLEDFDFVDSPDEEDDQDG